MHMSLMLTGIKLCVYCNATMFKIALVIYLLRVFFLIPQGNLTQFYTNLHYNVIMHLFAK